MSPGILAGRFPRLARAAIRARHQPAKIDAPITVFLAVRDEVRRSFNTGRPGVNDSPAAYDRKLSAATWQILAARGWRVPVVNERPPGWTLELDIAEEMAALSEMVAMRRIG